MNGNGKEKVKVEVENNGNGKGKLTAEDIQALYKAKDSNLSSAERYITELEDSQLNERTILDRKMISLMAIQITKEQAINPDRTKRLSQIWREHRQRLSLSDGGIARIQALSVLQSQQEVKDAEAALRD
jgi:hypothetical protein